MITSAERFANFTEDSIPDGFLSRILFAESKNRSAERHNKSSECNKLFKESEPHELLCVTRDVERQTHELLCVTHSAERLIQRASLSLFEQFITF